MIVTCESCKSRYKLDDSKVTGRGAKITCPKCRHVFVVLAGGVTAKSGSGLHWEEDEPTKVDESPAPAPKAAPRPSQPSPPSVSSPTIVPSAPAPAVMPVHEVVRPSSAATGPKVDYAQKALTLDFRKVGVAAWKAKIKIGLVYDFSDIKTLRRYIQDGRVTPSDVISWDGKSWKTIGDIPDLDAFFCETYDHLESEYTNAGAASAPAGPAPADLQVVAAAAAAMSDSGSDFNNSGVVEPTRARSKKSSSKNGPGARSIEMPPSSGGRSGGWIVAAIGVAALAGVGIWYGMQDPGGAAKAQPAATAAKPAAPKGPSGEDMRAEILNKLNAGGEKVEAAPGTDAAPATASTVGAAAGPPATPAAPATPASETPPTAVRQTSVPEGFTPVIPSGARTASSASSGSDASVKKTDSSAADHEALGDQAAASGDWGTAVAAYGKARAAGGRGGSLLYKLGKAQFQSGNLDAAASTLEQAKASYPAARGLLADVYDKLGDPAKASAERQAAGGSR